MMKKQQKFVTCKLHNVQKQVWEQSVLYICRKINIEQQLAGDIIT